MRPYMDSLALPIIVKRARRTSAETLKSLTVNRIKMKAFTVHFGAKYT